MSTRIMLRNEKNGSKVRQLFHIKGNIGDVVGLSMLVNGEVQKDAIRPDFSKSIVIDFTHTRITSDAGKRYANLVDQAVFTKIGWTTTAKLCIGKVC